MAVHLLQRVGSDLSGADALTGVTTASTAAMSSGVAMGAGAVMAVAGGALSAMSIEQRVRELLTRCE